jgi:hypothetical protein
MNRYFSNIDNTEPTQIRMSHRRSAVADAFYENFAWLSTFYGQFFSMILIVVIVMGVWIYFEQVEEAKHVEEQRIARAQAQAQQAWDEKSTLQKGIVITSTFLDVFLLRKTPS